jgi:hypothetical protein
VLLVTAHGSFDCQDSGEQESASSSLHYCDVVTERGQFIIEDVYDV